MRIDYIALHNFKNFEHLEVDFDKGINLLVGANGSGKTALLEGVCVALGAFFGSHKDTSKKLYIALDKIRIANNLRVETSTVEARSSEPSLKWARIKNRDGKNTSKGIESTANYGKQILQSFEQADNQSLAPIIAYYSTERLFTDAKQSKKQSYDPSMGRHNGYLQCLEMSAMKPLLVEWLKNAVTRRATLAIKNIDRIDLVLENVEEAVKKMLLVFLDLPDDFSLKIYQDPDYQYELFVDYQGDNGLPLSYYSDGFRNIIFLVIDIVWRASQLNPWLPLDALSIQLKGVVLIDEIDLHLHPKWQRKIVGFIKSLFPNVQYFITTHSPIVVSNFEREFGQLHIIANNGISHAQSHYFGREVNDVLTNILGAPDRHVGTQERLDKLLRLIDTDQDALGLYNELKDLLGADDPALMRAEALMSWNAYQKLNPDAIH